MNPKYPIYIISKGRYKLRHTSKALEKIGVPYRIVIEPQEFDLYSKVIDIKKILVLPFSNLGQGGIPARNWVWDHSTKEGHERHWIMDDNIRSFFRFNNNLKYYVGDGTVFKIMEDFVERYENVLMAGPNYHTFVDQRNSKIKPFRLNTRVYSCILLDNKTNYRWRGRYNEDTDLSLRILKDGHCTILFNAFLASKMGTMILKGGNTDELYKQKNGFDGRLEMAKSLQKQHPDVCRITKKWNRWQHHVDYSKFKNNKLIRKKDLQIDNKINNYKMKLIKV